MLCIHLLNQAIILDVRVNYIFNNLSLYRKGNFWNPDVLRMKEVTEEE